MWIAGGIYPFGFHLVNILLHGIVSALVVPVTNKLYGGYAPRMALLTSLLFAVHPIHTEAVSTYLTRAPAFNVFSLYMPDPNIIQPPM